MASMAQEKSKTLHNFSLPSWGNQKLLRCSNNLNDVVSVSVTEHHVHNDAVSVYVPKQRHDHDDIVSVAIPPYHRKRHDVVSVSVPPDRKQRRHPAHQNASFRSTNLNDAVTASVPPDRRKRQDDVVSVAAPPDHRKQRHDHNDVVSVSDRRRRHQNSSFRTNSTSIRRGLCPADDDDQIESIREKLIIDLRCEVDQMRAAILGNSQTTPRPPSPPPPPPAPEKLPEVRPWNLRARKAVCKDVPAEQMVEVRRAPARGGGEGGRRKFAVGLTREEIEEDFVKMAGKKPLRKPKKRARNVQRQMDTLFPGLWLSEVNADMYKVNDNPESGK